MEGLGRSYSKPLPSLAFFLFFCLFFVRLFFALFELLVFVVLIFSSDVECLPDNPFFRDCSSFFGFKSLLAFLFFYFVLLLFLFLFFFIPFTEGLILEPFDFQAIEVKLVSEGDKICVLRI